MGPYEYLGGARVGEVVRLERVGGDVVQLGRPGGGERGRVEAVHKQLVIANVNSWMSTDAYVTK